MKRYRFCNTKAKAKGGYEILQIVGSRGKYEFLPIGTYRRKLFRVSVPDSQAAYPVPGWQVCVRIPRDQVCVRPRDSYRRSTTTSSSTGLSSSSAHARRNSNSRVRVPGYAGTREEIIPAHLREPPGCAYRGTLTRRQIFQEPFTSAEIGIP
eukprot:2624489-Rhodomonas_salina.2